MERIFLLCLALFLMSVSSGAKDRTEEEMRQIALRVLNNGSRKTKGIKPVSSELVCLRKNKSYGLFSSKEGNGFVVVSTNEDAKPVLGYSDSKYDKENLPCGLKLWLDAVECAEPISYSAEKSSWAAIAPIVTTKWGQEEPFNLLTPMIGDMHAPSGCVATAMAQILNANRYPESATFSASYSVEGNDGIQMCNVNNTYSFPYNNIYGDALVDTGMVHADYSEDEGLAIATLMRDCGYATDMQYSKSGSGTDVYSYAGPIGVRFGYSQESLKICLREYYSDSQWLDIIHRELENGYPILYGAVDSRYGGHAFVVDGMDEQGLLHINWGWNGDGDGYFELAYFNVHTMQFNHDHHMVIGIRKEPLPGESKRSQIGASDGYELTTNGSNLYVTGGMFNITPFAYTCDICLVGENVETGEVKSKSIQSGDRLSPGYGYRFADEYVPIGWSAGTYKMYVASKASFDTDFVPVITTDGPICYNVTIAGKRGNLTFTIDGTPVPLETEVKSVLTNHTDTNTAYNLSGQVVDPSTFKGIVIKEGKKYIFK